MKKLFIFAIGGTGSRVVKSLTMLLAAGVKINAKEIVIIIIDPDRANGDYNRTLKLLKLYQSIRNGENGSEGNTPLEFTNNAFFNTKISTLGEIVSQNDKASLAAEDFRMEIEGVQNEMFHEFIAFDKLDNTNKALTSLLFSDDNLRMRMQEGFYGNPNIGSVVLNKFVISKEFDHFSSNYQEGDRIFIISSIFGGTGAAGFPLILKNIRGAKDQKKEEWLRNAPVGAVSVLPYFNVATNDKSRIDSATFIAKTKAALSYYVRNIIGNKSINALYLIGDKETKEYNNNVGAESQKNDAHFIELASALAIIDFMELPDNTLKMKDGKAVEPIYREFGTEDNAEKLHFKHLGPKTRNTIRKPLSKFVLFNLFLKNAIDDSLSHPWANAGKTKITKDFFTKDFYLNLKAFMKDFELWLIEMERNKASFNPFNLGVTNSNIFNIINGAEPKKSFLPFAKDNFELFISNLNSVSIGDLPNVQKFMGLFSKATDKLVKDKFDF